MDNPWTVAMVRAEKTGVVLAEILTNKVQGERAVSLVGYGLGARVIYTCLTTLSEKRAFGIVENVVLFGAPCPSEIRVWTAMKSVVAGRLINVYSRNDYLLGFLYRTCAWNFGVAGLQPIEGIPRVENVDLSDRIDNHLHYQYHIGDVLLWLRWEDLDLARIRRDLPGPSIMVCQDRNCTHARCTAKLESGEQHVDIMREHKADQGRKDRGALTKHSNGKREPKDQLGARQLNGKAKQAQLLTGHQPYMDAGKEVHKPRYKQNRAENSRPMAARRQQAR